MKALSDFRGDGVVVLAHSTLVQGGFIRSQSSVPWTLVTVCANPYKLRRAVWPLKMLRCGRLTTVPRAAKK